MPKPTYVLQQTTKSSCKECGGRVDLLCDAGFNPRVNKAWFYLCWMCHRVFQVGRGEVEREEI